MKILVIGHTGFLGRNLYSFLEAQGNYVMGASRRKLKDSDFIVDITNEKDFLLINEEPEVIVNCAAFLPGRNLFDQEYARQCFEVNAIGALNVAKYALSIQCKKVIHCSTLSVIAKPWPLNMNEEYIKLPVSNQAVYGTSKLSGETLLLSLLQNKISTTIVRISALYGPSMPWTGVMPLFIDQAYIDKCIKVSNGDSVFADFLFIDDAVECLAKLIQNHYTGIVNLASGNETSLTDLAAAVKNLVTDSDIEKSKEELSEPMRAKVRIEKLLGLIGHHSFTNITQGLQKTIHSKYG